MLQEQCVWVHQIYQEHSPCTINISIKSFCYISGNSAKKGPDKKQQKQTPPGNQYSSAADKEYSVNMGKVVFKVYQGDITNVKVDAIVNGTNTELDLTIGIKCHI